MVQLKCCLGKDRWPGYFASFKNQISEKPVKQDIPFFSPLYPRRCDTRLNSQKLNTSALLILNVFSCFLTLIAMLTAELTYIKVPDQSSCCDVTLFCPILTGRTQCFLSIFSFRLTCFSIPLFFRWVLPLPLRFSLNPCPVLLGA